MEIGGRRGGIDSGTAMMWFYLHTRGISEHCIGAGLERFYVCTLFYLCSCCDAESIGMRQEV